jgi:GntR family transcriptional repressor for pyruvate dehydrogenase complex
MQAVAGLAQSRSEVAGSRRLAFRPGAGRSHLGGIGGAVIRRTSARDVTVRVDTPGPDDDGGKPFDIVRHRDHCGSMANRRDKLRIVVPANPPSAARPLSAVNRIAQQLRVMALELPVGAHIGSEQSLSQQLFVSGPTLRQAIRLLEHEDLIEVRRGVRGGYFVARPQMATAGRVAATYLHGTLRSYQEVIDFVNLLSPIYVDFIIASGRTDEFEEFSQLIHDEAYEEFIERQTRFRELLMDTMENGPARLVYAIFLEAVISIPFERRPDRRDAPANLEALRAELAQALVARDREHAIAVIDRMNLLVGNAIMEQWAPART